MDGFRVEATCCVLFYASFHFGVPGLSDPTESLCPNGNSSAFTCFRASSSRLVAFLLNLGWQNTFV